MSNVMTLCLIHDDTTILLGMKKRGFGAGRWNGFGGKVYEGESMSSACQRELSEEANIEVQDLKERGKLLFEFKETGKILEVHLFTATKYSGVPEESEEMLPKTFSIAEIPYDNMWDDDKHWLPIILEGNNIDGYFLFDSNDKVLKKEIKVI